LGVDSGFATVLAKWRLLRCVTCLMVVKGSKFKVN